MEKNRGTKFKVSPVKEHGIHLIMITARKRSLGQGNIFTSVCHSFCPGGWWACVEEGCAWRGHVWQGGMYGKGACVAGGGACRQGVCIAEVSVDGRGGMHGRGGVSGGDGGMRGMKDGH